MAFCLRLHTDHLQLNLDNGKEFRCSCSCGSTIVPLINAFRFSKDQLTSAAGFPPRETHLMSVSRSSVVLEQQQNQVNFHKAMHDDQRNGSDLSSAPLMITGGSGGTRTVSLASRERIGVTPSAAPTFLIEIIRIQSLFNLKFRINAN